MEAVEAPTHPQMLELEAALLHPPGSEAQARLTAQALRPQRDMLYHRQHQAVLLEATQILRVLPQEVLMLLLHRHPTPLELEDTADHQFPQQHTTALLRAARTDLELV